MFLYCDNLPSVPTTFKCEEDIIELAAIVIGILEQTCTRVIADDDADAGNQGVAIGQMYELSDTNLLSLPEGLLKIRRN